MANLLIAADPIEPKKSKKKLLIAAEDDLPQEQEVGDPRDVLSETVQDTAMGAAQGATFNFADELYGMGASALGDKTYEEERDSARKVWEEARERSPVGSMVGEIGGSVFSPLNKVLGAGKGLKGVFRGGAEGAAQSYGATDEETIKGQALETVVGGGVGAGTGAISNLLTKTFSKSPNAMRSEVLGVKAKDYRVDGPGDRKKIVERIKDTGMLKGRKAEYNPQTLKFEPRSKSKFTLDEIEKNTEERLFNRSSEASEKLQERKIQEFGEALNTIKVPVNDLNKMAEEIADEYSKRGLSKGPIDRMKAAANITDHIKQQLQLQGSGIEGGVLLKDLDTVKRMAQEDVKNFSKSLGELGDSEELARITARKLKNIVENNVGSEEFKKINSAQHDMLSVKGDLLDRIKSLELESPGRKSYGHTGILDRLVEGATGSSQGRLDAANMKELYEGLPKIFNPAKAVIPFALEEAPGALYRQNMQGDNIRGNWRNPSNYNGATMITPREIINYKIPRTTQGILENKDKVVAKLVQNGVPDDLVDTITQALNEDHEAVSNIAPLIISQFPTIFERSKYKVFDGQFLDPQDRAKAADDISKRDDLNSVARAKMINEINKSGKVPEGMA